MAESNASSSDRILYWILGALLGLLMMVVGLLFSGIKGEQTNATAAINALAIKFATIDTKMETIDDRLKRIEGKIEDGQTKPRR